MRLEGFDYSQSGAYHITICTKNRERILWKDSSHYDAEDWKANLSEIGQIVDRHINEQNGHMEITVDEYVIMPDHVHILLFADKRNVQRPFPATSGNNDWVQKSDSTPGYMTGKTANIAQNKRIPHYVGTLKRFINREIGENIWQKSYYDAVIHNRDEYLKIRDYIENNPRNMDAD